MNRILRLPVAFLLVAGAIFVLSGCTAFGFGTGSSKDSLTPEKDIFTASQLDSIECGRTINVLRTDSTIVSGEYAGLDLVPDSAYAYEYAEHITTSPLGKLFPALGDGVLIVSRIEEERQEVSGQLIGFSEVVLRVLSSVHKQPTNVSLRFIDTVYASHGSVIDGTTLRRVVSEKGIPLIKTRLVVSNENDTTFIPIGSILEVWSTNSHYAKWVGLGIGAVLDGMIILLVSVLSNMGWRN